MTPEKLENFRHALDEIMKAFRTQEGFRFTSSMFMTYLSESLENPENPNLEHSRSFIYLQKYCDAAYASVHRIGHAGGKQLMRIVLEAGLKHHHFWIPLYRDDSKCNCFLKAELLQIFLKGQHQSVEAELSAIEKNDLNFIPLYQSEEKLKESMRQSFSSRENNFVLKNLDDLRQWAAANRANLLAYVQVEKTQLAAKLMLELYPNVTFYLCEGRFLLKEDIEEYQKKMQKGEEKGADAAWQVSVMQYLDNIEGRYPTLSTKDRKEEALL